MPAGKPRLKGMSAVIYLKTMSILFTLAIGLPLLIVPLSWARLMRWQIPADTDLTNYFGRCLGAVVTAIAFLVFVYADKGALHAFMLELLLGAFALMVAVHVWGFLKRAQPWTETAEIPLYLLLSLSAAGFRFGWFA